MGFLEAFTNLKNWRRLDNPAVDLIDFFLSVFRRHYLDALIYNNFPFLTFRDILALSSELC